MDYEKLLQALCEFIKDKIKDSKTEGVVLGLSGGVDSAVVAHLCKRALKDKVFALLMPSASSNQDNIKDALELCKELNIEHKILPIQEILNAFLKECERTDRVRVGNLAARIRMSLLYDFSMLKNSLVIGTSNKSELILGYGTIYGDLACAFNPIGDLYKSEVYGLARFLKINATFIQKVPSADLWEGQSDEIDLGFSYDEIDKGLKALEKGDEKKLLRLDEKLIQMLKHRRDKNAFKRKMPEIFSLRTLNDLA